MLPFYQREDEVTEFNTCSKEVQEFDPVRSLQCYHLHYSDSQDTCQSGLVFTYLENELKEM